MSHMPHYRAKSRKSIIKVSSFVHQLGLLVLFPGLPWLCSSVSLGCRFSQDLHCSRCNRHFSANETSVDLTPTSGADMRVFTQKLWGGTQLFRWHLAHCIWLLLCMESVCLKDNTTESFDEELQESLSVLCVRARLATRLLLGRVPWGSRGV